MWGAYTDPIHSQLVEAETKIRCTASVCLTVSNSCLIFWATDLIGATQPSAGSGKRETVPGRTTPEGGAREWALRRTPMSKTVFGKEQQAFRSANTTWERMGISYPSAPRASK